MTEQSDLVDSPLDNRTIISADLAKQLSSTTAQYNLCLPSDWSEFEDEKRIQLLIEMLLLHARAATTFHFTVDAFDLRELATPRNTAGTEVFRSFSIDDNSMNHPKMGTKPLYPPTLKRLLLDHGGNTPCIDLDDISYFLEALSPSLNELCLTRCKSADWILEVPRSLPGHLDKNTHIFANVTHLQLHLCALDLPTVAKMIRSCSRLETFNLSTYCGSYNLEGIFGDEGQELKGINQLLLALTECHGSALRGLTLNLQATKGRFTDENGHWRERQKTTRFSSDAKDMVSTLEELSVLEMLAFDFRHVFAATRPSILDVLPASIQVLFLSNNVMGFEAELMQLANAVEGGKYPVLWKVSVDLPDDIMEDSDDDSEDSDDSEDPDDSEEPDDSFSDGEEMDISPKEVLRRMDKVRARMNEVGVWFYRYGQHD